MTENPTQPATEAYPYPLLIKQLLHYPLANSPDREIVYADRLRYDYRTFRDRIARIASGLRKLGVERGSTVAVMDWDSNRYFEFFFAIPMMGAVLHTINVRLSPEQILYTINHAEDDFILVHTEFIPMVEQIRDRMEGSPKLVLLKDDGGAPHSTLDFSEEYESILRGGDPSFEFEDFDENTRATTFYTTGTTGDPKGVHYSHRQIVLHTLGISAGFGMAEGHGRFHREDVYMPITPMFHVHAWGIPFIATMMGVKQVYPGRYDPAVLLRLIRDEGVTFSHCVPTILHMLLSSPELSEVDLTGWKVVIGGSALPPGMAKLAMSLGIDIYSGYGMSETCPVLTTAHLDSVQLERPLDEQVTLRCKTGRAHPMVELKVVDPDMNDLPRDGQTSGEIVVRSPWISQGYFKNPEASEALWRGGYLHTGDIGYIDPDGYLKITDRVKDVIKSGGEWISSLTLEDTISQHPGVSEVAAIGIPHDKWGERPLVLIVPKDGEDAPTEDVIKAHVQAHADRGEISPWAVPDQVILVEAIEKTSVGKIDKKLLRQKYAELAG